MPARQRAANRVRSKRPAAGRELHAMQDHENIFETASADNTLRASFWLQFLHWNNSRLEKSYCIKGL
jgi:hypothetical protein